MNYLRSKLQGGSFDGDDSVRQNALKFAYENGADFVEIDLEVWVLLVIL